MCGPRAHECGESDGRDSDHPQYVGCSTNPHEESLLARTVDRRFVGVVEESDEIRRVLIRGTVAASTEDHAVLAESMHRHGMRDGDWRLTRQEVRNLIPGDATERGALVTTTLQAFVEQAFADVQPDDTITVVTLTLRERPASLRYQRHEEPRPRFGRIIGHHL